MSPKSFAATATLVDAESAALEMLSSGGSALDAVLAGYFALAGSTTWALFAPATFAVAGGGAGVHFLEAHPRQPGASVARPPRYERGDEAPKAPRISVPTNITSVATAIALGANRTLAMLAGVGKKAAKAAGASEREAFLGRIGSAGPLALRERKFLDALDAVATRVDGRLLGEDDFAAVAPEVGALDEIDGELTLARPPWHAEIAMRAGARHVIVAGDRAGSMAAIVLEGPVAAAPLFGGELDLPLLADVLRKGQPRTAPGARLPTATPIAVRIDDGVPSSIVAALAPTLSLATLRAATTALTAAPTGTLSILRSRGASPTARKG